MLQALGTQSVAPTAHGYFYDRLNGSLLYIRQGQLFSHNLSTNINSLIPLANSTIPTPTPSPHSLLTLSGSVVQGVQKNIISTSSQEAILRGTREVVEGSHWEWFAPISLQKIQLGVCRIQENQAIIYQFFQFNSSTPRTVSFYASANELKVWVNGNHPNKQHSKSINFTAKEKWFPCVKMEEKGNTIGYLPFSTLSSKEYSPYNPFGKIEIFKPNLSNCVQSRQISKISKLIQLDRDRFLVHWQKNSARLFKRNKQTGQFDFSSFSVTENITYDLFSSSEIELIKRWRSQQDLINPIMPVTEAYYLIRYLISLLDSQKSKRIDLYSLLLCKLALIRPYLVDAGIKIPNSLAVLEADQENLHNVLKYFKLPFKTIPSSSLIHANTQYKLQGEIVEVTEHYLVSQSEGSIILYTTKGCIKELFRETVDSKLTFSKRAVTDSYEDGDIRNLKSEGSFIYKILTTCLQKQKKPEELHAVNQENVKELVRDYGIDDNSAREALEHTGNVEQALVWIFTDRKEGLGKKGESANSVDNHKQLISLVEINNLFAKLILQVGNRVLLMGVLPNELKKWVQKGDKEYVDLFSLKHQDEVEDLNWQEWFNGAKHPMLHILDQIQLQETPSIVYKEEESVYLLSYKEGVCFQSKLSFNFDLVYEPHPSLRVENVQQIDLKMAKESISKTLKGELITPHNYNSVTFTQGTVYLFENEVYHNIVEPRVKIDKFVVRLEDGLIPTLENENESYLPFLVESCAPGCNNNYSATSLLNPKASFLANYSQQIILRHLHNKIWKPTVLSIQRSSNRKNINYILQGDVYLTDAHNNNSKMIHFTFSQAENEKEIRFDGVEGYWKYIHIVPVYPSVKKLPYEVGCIKIKGFDTSPQIYYHNQSILVEKKVEQLVGKSLKLIGYENNNNQYRIRAVIPQLTAEERITFITKFSLQACVCDEQTLRDNESIDQLKPSQIIQQLVPPSFKIQALLRSISRSTFTFSSFSKIQVYKFIDLALFYTGSLLEFQSYYSRMFTKLWQNPHGKQYLHELSQHLDSIPIIPLPFLKMLISHLESNHLHDSLKLLLAAVAKTRSKQYGATTEKKIPYLIYETQFYSDYYFNSIEGESKIKQHLFSQPQINIQFLSIKEETSRRIIVKLAQEHMISNLTLKLERSEHASKANYSVYVIESKAKCLVGSGRIQEYQWGQLSKEIYKREIEQVYQNCSQLNSFGLQIPQIRAKYIQIELSFTELANFGHSSEMSRVPQGDVVPQLYGYSTGVNNVSQAVEDIFVFNPEEMFFLATSSVSTVPLLKYSVSKGKQTQCLYYKMQEDDQSAIRAKICEKIEKKEFQSVISLQRKLIRGCKVFSSKICLDYLYTVVTLILNTLDSRKVEVDEAICKDLYELLVKVSYGPIKLTAFKALSHNISYLMKGLQYVQQLLTSLGKLTFSYEDLVGVLDFNNIQLCQSLTRLILRVVDCQPRWTQLLIKMSGKTQTHEEIVRFFTTNDLWLQNKAVLEYVAHFPDHFFQNEFLVIISYGQMCKLVTRNEAKDRRQLMLEVIVDRASQDNQVGLDVVGLVFEQSPVRWDHLQKIATCCNEAVETVVHQYLQSQDAASLARQHQTLLELALQPKYSEELAVFLGKVYHQDCQTFKDLILRASGKIITLHYDCLQFLNDFICKKCNFGGIQGAKLLTQNELSSLSVAVQTLKVLQKAPEAAQLANERELIEWYLLNNEYEEENGSPANRSQGYYLMRQLIELVRNLLQNCQQLTLKVLEKYTSEVQRLRGSRRISLIQKHRFFHRLHNGATQLSLAALPAGQLAQILVGSSSPVLSMVLGELKKSTLAGKGRKGKEFISKEIDISDRFKPTNCQPKDMQGGRVGVKSPAMRIPLDQKQLLFDAEELQWPSKIAVGFVLNDHIDNKTSILPSSLQLFAGNGKALFKLAELKQSQDQFYLSFGVRVYVADLNTSSNCGLISGGVKKLELRLHQPILSSTSEVLQNLQKTKKGATYNISFIHIGGYDSLPSFEPDYSELYVTLLGFLGQPKYQPDLRALLASDLFDQKLQLIIQVLNDLLPNDSIQQLLMNLNKQGENILEHVLRSPSANHQLVSKLILGKLTRQNIARLLTYTLEHLNQEFVRIVTMSLKLASYAQPQQPLRTFSDFANIEQLVTLYQNSSGSTQELYFKLLVGLLSVPNLYHYDIHKLTTLAWQQSDKSRLYTLIAAVLPFYPSEANNFASKNLTTAVLQELLSIMEQNKKAGITQTPQPQLLLLNSLINSQSSKKVLLTTRSPIKIVQLIRCQKNLLVQYPPQVMKLFISYFQNTCIGSECQNEFSDTLIALMTSLNLFNSSSQQFFIHHFFFPLINSFQGVTVYFSWSHSGKRIWQPTQVLKAAPIRSSNRIICFEEKFYAPIESIQPSTLKEELVVVLKEDDKVIFKCSAGKITDVATGKQLAYTHKQGILTIKLTQGSSFNLPNENYTILEQTSWEQQLLTNATLLNLQNPWILQEKYRVSLPPKDAHAERAYYLPQQMPLSQILKSINIAGFRINPKDLATITIKNHLDGSVIEQAKTLKQVLQNQKMPFIRLEIDASQIFKSSTIESLVQDQPKTGIFVARHTIFKSFEEKKGLQKLIGVLYGTVSNWRNIQQGKIWGQYMKELQSYSCFPVFSSFYVTKPANINLLFDLLFGLPDKQDSKKWLLKQKQSVKELYSIVKEIFAVEGQQAKILRSYAVKSGFYSTILNRLHIITKEIKRYRVEEVKEDDNIVPIIEKKAEDAGDDFKTKLIKKKGVGYGTDSSTNQKWNLTGQEEQRKEQSEQILGLLKILEKYLDHKEFQFPSTMLQETFESALLPIIENSLRGGSLLQISKYAELIEGELNFIEVLAKNKSLVQCLMPIPKHYEPRQPECLHSLLKTLANTSKIFISCLTGSASEKLSEQIAKKILSTFQIVDEAVSEYQNTHNDQISIKKILQLPLGKKYPILLKDLRFDYIDMKDTTGKITKHHYSSSYQVGHKSPIEKTVRLAQELADVSHALPIDHTNAIFVRCDRERVDYMQALIMGSNGTPYGHGAYLFDIHFEDNYPNGPPKVNLTTTGSGQIRFNPNLYACGKVCLSLLGTWRGSAMENWDPKVSTLLQVLVSIQSIIMSEDIYFNEPGFQHEQGTLEGEKKNEAYANIVRYGNVKFAMLENIKNPPKGFQTVIRRHFQLKKHEILEQCQRWLKLADKRQASYNGLVSDHNYNWCNTFKKSTKQYKTMLQKAVRQLQIELNKLPQPTLEDTKKEVSPVKKQKKQKIVQHKEEVTEEIDVSYGGARENVEMDINDERVRDRWSRYIGAMGVEAVSKQSKASILLFGLGALGLEIAKNIVLSGCKELALWDDKLTQWDDLSGQFFLGEEDVGHSRLDRTIYKLRELNHYVKVSKFEHSPDASLQALAGFQVVITTNISHEQQIKINEYCRINKIKFISSDTFGPFGQVFNDFGEEFEVLDKNGEETVQVIVQDISIAERAIVKVAKGLRHPYEDGQTIRIVGVKGMKSTTQGQSINGSLHKIEVINQSSFYISSTLNYTPYEGDGTVRNIKTPIKLNFKSLPQSVTAQNIDQNLQYYDYTKGGFLRVLHSCFIALSSFKQTNGRTPLSWSKEDAELFQTEVRKIKSEFSEAEIEFVRLFSYTCEGNFGSISAFLGGVVSQQAFKAITGKYTPINQYFMVDFSQIIERPPKQEQLWAEFIEHRKPKQTRSDGIRKLIGNNVLQKLENSKVFMVGSGAIGCELLKNFAMIEIGTSGQKGGIIVTDPDHIQTSNLNRQFLFRQKHLRKPKSATAAAAVSQMNPRLKGRIKARLEKVCGATKETFSNSFFEELTIVTNALDNVQARRYVDSRCVENKVPLLESGTLSSKGHVQVIIPYKTQSYGSKQDPNDTNGEVPQCTLKMFPEETLHCVEWARDLFGRDFTLAPKALAKLLEAGESFTPTPSDLQMLKDCVRMLESRPTNFEQAISTATGLFYQLFRNDIMQLLYTYPLDSKTKDGKPFWKLPKRPPTPIESLDAKDPLHATFITSYAVLLCKVHNIPHPKDFRDPNRRFQIAQTATTFKVVTFTPSDKLAKEMTEEVNKENQKQSEGATNQPSKQQSSQIQLFINFSQQLADLKQGGETVTSKAEQFQKDQDQNGHIDLIYSMANLRARNYALQEMEWIGVKLKAGRITPALSTTTSCIAALQTIQLLKYIKGCPMESLRNAFVNLAVPIVQLGQPGQVQKIKVHDKLDTNVWERWEVSLGKESPLRELISVIQEKYGVIVKGLDMLEGGQIYSDIVLSLESKKDEKQRVLNKTFMQTISEFHDFQANHADFTLLMAVGDQLVQHAPTLRVLLK